MSNYAAPLKDMLFAIREIAGLAEVTALPGCEDATPELVGQVLEEAGKFAREVLDPINRQGDQEGAKLVDGAVTAPRGFKDAYRQFTAAGWNALGGRTEYGGQGLPHVVAMPVQEIWNGACVSFCIAPMLTAGVLEALGIHGSPGQKKLYFPRLTSGEWCGTMNLTEPQAGSDLSAVRTRAVLEGDHYRIHGTKIFITWGEHDMADNIVHLVLARTPDAPEGVKGISLFIVPKFLPKADGTPGERNDVRCVSIEHKMGIRATPTCVLAYGDGPGAIGYLVGEENRGLEYMFTMMNHARLGVGIEGVALAERACQHALDYAKTRVQGREIGQKSGDRVTIIHHPDVRRMLLSMKAQVEAMRSLAYFTAALLDKSKHHPEPAGRRRSHALLDLLTPVVKGWCTEQAVEIASTGVQVHGGMGFIEETGAAQYLRDARITTIYEGTTGIQANDLVGRKVGAEKGATALALAGEMQGLASKLTAAGGSLAPISGSYAEGVGALTQATRWIVETFPRDPRAVAAVSVPYLKLFGTVAGGWMMARAALIATAQLKQPDADREFLEAKLATARFYVEHELPKAAALAREVTHGAGSVLAVDPSMF
ncbi:MAG TPA: acyl-CoA dehydrogenase [Burkholderiales bacterium]|jgi:alkylation response protein AidB-like acyl-CoA dehydrogenase|nr:acyl-CoA dehydrogenase [Burkholderiales bacterium]